MKSIFRSFLYCCAFAMLALSFTACGDDDTEGAGNTGISNVNNPREGKDITKYGETITISFQASGSWNAELVLTPNTSEWATITGKTGNTAGGKSSVLINIHKNETVEPRTSELWIAVSGKKRTLICTLTQSGGDSEAELSLDLNGQMDKILQKEYLWNKDYSKLNVDLTVPYQDFLFTHLTQLGETNIEDGGYWRDYTSSRGERYIFSNIYEVTSGKSSSAKEYANETPSTRAAMSYGLGIGPTMATKIWADNPTRGLMVGYVYSASSAEKAGLKRGDIIYEVNGQTLNPSNYSSYQNELFYSPVGTYNFKYIRHVRQDDGTYLMVEGFEAKNVTTGNFDYNPVIYAAVIPPEATGVKDCIIGYAVLEAFDASAQEKVEWLVNEFASQKITDMILDLRFNPGGSVAQSRYLTSAIAGRTHDEDVFVNCEFNDSHKEPWSFGTGYAAKPDNLGKGTDLGLKRLFVITSENTASASELLINGLKGVDIPVYVYGSPSLGKNVGMTVQYLSSGSRRFEFSPITFWCSNAKDFGDYADGFKADYMVNNQNSSYTDDLEPYFPYTTFDWEDLALDAANYWAFCHITGRELPDAMKKAQEEQGSVSPEPLHSTALAVPAKRINGVDPNTLYKTSRIIGDPERLEQAPIRLTPGRYGNIINPNNE